MERIHLNVKMPVVFLLMLLSLTSLSTFLFCILTKSSIPAQIDTGIATVGTLLCLFVVASTPRHTRKRRIR